MSDHHAASLYLQRIDATRNMARFYGLSVQPTLFGSVSLIRHWGRIGKPGRFKIETFDDPSGLERTFGRIAHKKRARGYAEPGSPV